MGNTTVQEAMTPSPRSIERDASVIDAARLLTSEDVGSLPVVEGEQLVGMVTDRDLVLRVLAKDLDPHKTVVADACTEDPEVTTASESLDTVLQRMAKKQVRRLPGRRRWRTTRGHPRPGGRRPRLAGVRDRPNGRGDLGGEPPGC